MHMLIQAGMVRPVSPQQSSPRVTTYLGVQVHQCTGQLIHHVPRHVLCVLLRLSDCPVFPQVLACPVHHDADPAALISDEHEADQVRVVQLLQYCQLLLNLRVDDQYSKQVCRNTSIRHLPSMPVMHTFWPAPRVRALYAAGPSIQLLTSTAA